MKPESRMKPIFRRFSPSPVRKVSEDNIREEKITQLSPLSRQDNATG